MKTIKRYPNRKLYDTDASRYITLDEIAEFLRSEGEVRVVDSRTGEDMTAVTLAQVLVGEEKKRAPNIPIQPLMTLFQSGSDFLKQTLTTPVASLRDEAEKTVQKLWHGEQAEEVKEFILSTHRAYEDIQRRVDERFHVVLGAMRNLSPILKEVDRLKKDVADLRARMEVLEANRTKK